MFVVFLSQRSGAAAVKVFDSENSKILGQDDTLASGQMEQTYADFYSGRGGLKFIPPLELKFQNMFLARDWRYIRLLHTALLALYFVYGVFDFMLLGREVYSVWMIRYLVSLPLMAVLFFLGRAQWMTRWLQLYTAIGMCILILTTLWMIAVVPREMVTIYLASLLAMVMGGLTIARMRFWYVVATSIVFIAGSMLILIPAFPQWNQLTYFFMLDLGSVLFCSVGAYAFEHSLRREFLQHTLIQQKNRQLADANEKLKHLADVDALTGVYNRRYLDNALDEEWRRARRRSYHLSLLMIDIDYFKAYNDSVGHVQGDHCIKAVAQCIKEMFHRPGDLVARYGGEEFAVLLPELTLDEAFLLAKLVCENVQGLGIVHSHSKVAPVVTVSVGVSELCPTPEHELRDLVRMADDALYQAKRGGRNRAERFVGVLPTTDAV